MKPRPAGRWDRPELHRMLDQLRKGDVVVVWKLDRLSRSLKDLLHAMERIGDAGAGFRSITEAIDTSHAGRPHDDANGRRLRVRARYDQGTDLRRPGARRGPHRRPAQEARSRQAPGDRETAESAISGRKTGAEMARLYNISPPTVSRIVAAHRTGLEAPDA